MAELLKRVLSADISPWTKEVIVVDDASTDGTPGILKGFRKSLKVIRLDENGGKGTAVRRGLSEALGDYIVIQDADLEYDPVDIPALLKKLDS